MPVPTPEAFADVGANHALPTNGDCRPERRQRARILVHWPVLLFQSHTDEAIETTTQNLSSVGFYCLSRTPLTPGEYLYCALRFPSHERTNRKNIRVLECRVRVMRSEPTLTDGYFGLAFQIDDYRVVPESRPSAAAAG